HHRTNRSNQLLDHLVGAGEDRRGYVEAERARPAKLCRPSEFIFLVADIPDADYFTRCVLDRLIAGHVRFAEDVDFTVESLTFVDIRYRFSLRVRTPATVKRTVRRGRLPNSHYRTREYLTEKEVERLMKAAGRNRYGVGLRIAVSLRK